MNNSSESYYTLTTIDHVNSYKKNIMFLILYTLYHFFRWLNPFNYKIITNKRRPSFHSQKQKVDYLCYIFILKLSIIIN